MSEKWGESVAERLGGRLVNSMCKILGERQGDVGSV